MSWVGASVFLFQFACGTSEPAARKPKTAVDPEPAQVAPRRPTSVQLPAADVLFGLQSDLPAMRACLPSSGSLQLAWTVDERGESKDFRANWTTLPQAVTDQTLESCLRPLIERRHFELPSGATQASATWTFVKKLPVERSRRGRDRRQGGVEFDPPGSLPTAEVDGIVQSGMRLYAHCLRAGIEKRSNLHGKLSLSWQVDANGNARTMVDAGSNLKDQAVIDCAAECFYALRFPEPKQAPVKVTYSLLLNED